MNSSIATGFDLIPCVLVKWIETEKNGGTYACTQFKPVWKAIADDIEISVADYSSNNEFYWFRVSTVETLTDKMLKTGSKICRERIKW